MACLIAAGWLPSPPLAVLTAFLAVAARGFQTGRQLSRSIPDKAGGAVCARFVHAWGAWKLGWAAFALMFITAILSSAAGNRCEPPPEFMAAAWLWMGGVATAAVLTDPGMLKACRSVMRVWAGDGVNGPGRSC